jgi:hypothetical protein
VISSPVRSQSLAVRGLSRAVPYSSKTESG